MSRLIVIGCVVGLLVAFFGGVIFQPHALIFRDAAHFYYPLFKLVQQEWDAGRVPLWNPYENGGHPLAGNPTASVFYPLKLLFFLPLSYAVLYKTYILVHVLLCAAGAYAMARQWGGSVGAGGLCAISYAFSATVVFQYANVVFLCGAAWIPVALIAADRALRLGRRPWAVALGFLLALQVLAGDPQAAYLCGVLATWYAAMLWWLDRSVTTVAQTQLSEDRPSSQSRYRVRMLLITAATALLLAAVQIVPSWQLSQRSIRAYRDLPRNPYELAITAFTEGRFEPAGLLGVRGRAPHQIYEFSTGPWRWPELLWPNVSGRQFPVNTRWIHTIADETTVWTPSLYMGLLPLLLAMSAWRFRTAPVWQTWLQRMVALGLLGALGRFGIVWLLRLFFGQQFAGQPGTPGALGDEVGGLYWLLTVLLPGFVNFRYPSKLLVFAAIGLSGLAALGWDRAMQNSNQRIRRWLITAFAVSLTGALALLATRAPLLDLPDDPQAFRDRTSDSYYGPIDVPGAWRGALTATLHGAVVAALAWSLLVSRGKLSIAQKPAAARWVPAGLLLLTAGDLAVANRWLVLTAPQADHEPTPRALEMIRGAEAADGDEQPYRVFRTLFFAPLDWYEQGASDRPRVGFNWERNTLMPKYGLADRVHYTLTAGTMSLYEYEFFFGPWGEPPARPTMVYYPQRGFDYWNTKYFILPWHRKDPQGRSLDLNEHRGIASFLWDLRGKAVPRVFPTTPEEEQEAERLDFQILRNPDYYPRAWIVHRLIPWEPLTAGTRDGRDDIEEVMELMLRQGRPDLRSAALVEVRDDSVLDPFNQPAADTQGEVCRITRYEPQLVELTARLNAPGMLVLADVYYPGWQAEVDGTPTEIFRTNRMMRGVPLSAGEHRIVFTYRPASFRWAALLSTAAWLVLVVAAFAQLFRRRRSRSGVPA